MNNLITFFSKKRLFREQFLKTFFYREYFVNRWRLLFKASANIKKILNNNYINSFIDTSLERNILFFIEKHKFQNIFDNIFTLKQFLEILSKIITWKLFDNMFSKLLYITMDEFFFISQCLFFDVRPFPLQVGRPFLPPFMKTFWCLPTIKILTWALTHTT